MARVMSFWFGLLLVTVEVESAARRHEIYWNTKSTPKLLLENDYVIHVKIGEFMDVICPQRSLLGITTGPEHLVPFTIYNVTKENFDKCRYGGRRDFMFACNRPDRENKLTIKFQTISPSPLGFRFRYCADYYFVAIPQKDHRKNPGCRKNTTRLRISVKCKYNARRTTTTTTTTTTTSTTSSTTTTATLATSSLLNRKTSPLLKVVVNTANAQHEKIVKPDVAPVGRGQNGSAGKKQRQQSDGGRNACGRLGLPSYPVLTVTSFSVWITLFGRAIAHVLT